MMKKNNTNLHINYKSNEFPNDFFDEYENHLSSTEKKHVDNKNKKINYIKKNKLQSYDIGKMLYKKKKKNLTNSNDGKK